MSVLIAFLMHNIVTCTCKLSVVMNCLFRYIITVHSWLIFYRHLGNEYALVDEAGSGLLKVSSC